MSSSREIRLVEAKDGQWSAIDEETDMMGEGETRQQALENLDEVVALHNGTDGDSIGIETEYLREMGIDPESVEDTRSLPELMK